MNELYDLRDMLCKELKGYSSKGVSNGTLDTVDKLAHALKNVDKIIECREEGYSGSYSPHRDRMGRYMRDYPRDYSRHGGMVDELRELMADAKDERTRQEFKRFIDKLESM